MPLWTRPDTHLEPLPVTSSLWDLLGPFLPLLGSLPQSAGEKQVPGETGSKAQGGGAESVLWVQHDISYVDINGHTSEPRGTC